MVTGTMEHGHVFAMVKGGLKQLQLQMLFTYEILEGDGNSRMRSGIRNWRLGGVFGGDNFPRRI